MNLDDCVVDESRELEERIISCLPAATFEMETLCRLTGIEADSEISTAAVECTQRPRLLVNPDFVRKRCRADEHLFLLVMHELYHIILAHTTLYPRVGVAQNIAFDAVINAGLSRQFQEPEYRGFFEEVNPADTFPGLLLRPPLGWPKKPRYPDTGPSGTREILEQLYPPGRDDERPLPTYQEILDLLLRSGLRLEGFHFLLGDHRDAEGEERALDDPLLGDIIRRIVSRWPPPPFPLGGRDLGRESNEWLSAINPVPEQTRRSFVQVLKRSLGPAPGRYNRIGRVDVQGIIGSGVLPNARDRKAQTRRLLGLPSTLWEQQGIVPARVRTNPSRAHVYLDVSGSMGSLLPYLLGLLLPYAVGGTAKIFQFSTCVEELPLEKLRRSKLTTTLGTDINPVLEHILADARVRRALLLTDGYTGRPRHDLANKVQEKGVRIHVVLPGESCWKEDLERVASTLTVLPPLYASGTTWRP